MGRTHTPHLNSIDLSYKCIRVAWREFFPSKNDVLFFMNFAKILKHLFNRTEQNITSENNHIECNAR